MEMEVRFASKIKITYLINCFIMLTISKFTIASLELHLMPILNIEMSNVGFHRDLSYTVHFDYPMAGKDCEYYLEQNFSQAVYVSVDQLDDLVRIKKLTAIYPLHIDVEISAENAFPFSALLQGRPKISENIILPIHFRYHSPSTTNFVRVEIDTPKMYLKCPDEDNIDNKFTSNDSFCIEGSKFKTENDFSGLSSTFLQDNCGWKLIEYDLHLKNLLMANIPVGDSNLYEIVYYITMLVSWLGCISILGAAHSKVQILKNKIK